MGALDQYDPIFQAAAQEWNLDPAFLKAVARQESGGAKDPAHDLSTAGARGVMNLMPDTARGLGVTDITDPVQNIYGGAKYLSQGLDKEGSPERALLYYHGGPGWRDRWGPESAGYVPGVTAHYQRLTAAANGNASPSPQRAAPVAAAAKKPADDGLPSDADFLARTTAPAPAAAKVESDDAFLARTAGGAAAAPAAPAAAPEAAPEETTVRGVARNVAAAGTDIGANILNMATTGAGMLGKLPATALVFAHDAAAPYLGYQRFPDDVRNMLLQDQVQAPGSALVNATGQAIGADPEAVPATDAERMVRKGVAGAGSAALLAPGGALAAGMGGGGAVAGDVAGQAAPAWAAPAAELAGNIGGGLAVGGAAMLPRAAGMANRLIVEPLARPVENFLAGADPKAAVPSAVEQRIAAIKQQVAAQPNALQLGPDGLPVAPSAANANEPRQAGWNQPEAAGAAPTPAAQAAMETRDTLANRSVAERSKLNETQPAGTADRNLYIPGVIPTTAEIEQSVNIAREQKALNIRSPEVSEEAKDIAAANNEKRQAFLQNEIIPSKVQVVNQKAATETQIAQDYPAAFANKQPVPEPRVQAVADTINEKLNDLRGSENTQLQKYIKPLLDRLADEDGNFKTDPERLYGLREDMNRMRSKASQADDKNLTHVQGELGDIIKVLDQAIEAGAPGYRRYMDNTAANLSKLDAMETLRSHESDFYDAQNRIQYARVQRVLRDVVEGRDAPSQVMNGYKHIPQDVLDRLWALRDDLRRSATAKELAATPGSDTAQNLWDTVKGVAGGIAGNTAAHIAANATLGPLGSAAVNVGKAALGNMRAGKAARADLARGMNLLHPDPTTLRNPLQD